MSIIDTIRNIFGAHPDPVERKSLVAASRPAWDSFTPTYATSAKFEVLVKEGYRKNELIYACINRSAATGAQITLTLTKKESGERVEEHPLLALLRKPNPNLSEAEFWGLVITQQKLAGRAIFEKERTNGGQCVALWPLRPDWITVVPARNRPVIEAYVYSVPGAEPRTLKAVDVLDFPTIDPLDNHTTYPPVAVAARVGDVDNNITDFVKLLLEHGGMPMGVLKTTLVLTPEDAEQIRRAWQDAYGGFIQWVKNIAVLDRDAEYQRTGLTMTELGFDSIDARDEARICSVLDVPPILVGAKVGLDKSTYSNYETAHKAWWQNSIIPMYNSFLDTLNAQLVPEFGLAAGLALGWDVSKVPALQESADALWTRTISAFSAGLLTLNQALTLLNQDTQENGDYYLRPSSVTMVPLDEADVKPEPPPALAQPGQPGQNEEGENEGEEMEDEPASEEEPGEKALNRAQVSALRELARAIDGKAEPQNVAPNISITLPSITVNIPEQEPPTVNVEAAQPPMVTVEPANVEVKVEPQITIQPAPVNIEPPRQVAVMRDKDGNITGMVANG